LAKTFKTIWIMKNWKTTLIGFAGAFWLVAQPIITNGDFDIARDWKSLVAAAIATAFGLFAKDNNVTGGNTQSFIGLPKPPEKP